MARTKNNANQQQDKAKKQAAKETPLSRKKPTTRGKSRNVAKDATVPLPIITLERAELKAYIQRAVKQLIIAHNPQGNIIRTENADVNAQRDGSEIPDEIGARNWLEWHQVYGIIPSLVAKRPHLADTVGVFPIYNAKRMNEFAQALAEVKIIEHQGLPTRTTPEGDVVLLEKPLPEDKDLSKKQREAKLRTQAQRNEQAIARKEQARALLAEQGFTQQTMFRLYLEALGESDENFIGNPKKPNLKLDDCTQLIIPFNFNNIHYAVSVIHFVEVNKEKIADIQFYNSDGSDLDESLQNQLVAYCEGLGFKPQYRCISKPDQIDSWECSMFASYKGIDIANENVGNEERFLSDLTKANYEQRLAMLRYNSAHILEMFGQNVTVGDDLVKFLKNNQKEFEKLSVHSQAQTKLNALICDHISWIKAALESEEEDSQDNILLPDKDPSLLFKEYKECYEQVINAMEALKKKKRLNASDKKALAKYESQAHVYQIAHPSIASQIQALKTLRQQIESPGMLGGSWFARLEWKSLSLLIATGFVATMMGIPFITSLGIQMSALLTTNAAVTFMLCAGVFSAGFLVSTFTAHVINAQPKTADNANKLFEVVDEEIPEVEEDPALETVAKPLLSQYQRKDKQGAGSSNKPIEVQAPEKDADIEIVGTKEDAKKTTIGRRLFN